MNSPHRVLIAVILLVFGFGHKSLDAASVLSASVHQMQITANDLVYNPATGKLYASIASSSSTNPNSIAIIDPTTETVESTIAVGSNPNRLALSSDGQTLYVTVVQDTTIQKVNLTTRTVDLTFVISQDTNDPIVVKDLVVNPANANQVVVAQDYDFVPYGTVYLYDNGVRMAQSTKRATSLAAGPNRRLYTYNGGTTGYDTIRAEIGSTGIVNAVNVQGLLKEFETEIEYDNGLLYGSAGRVIQPDAMHVVGMYQTSEWGPGVIEPISSKNRVFIYNSRKDQTLYVFNQQTFLRIGTVSIPIGEDDRAKALTQAGGNKLALLSADALYFIDYSEFLSRPSNLGASAGGTTSINLMWSDNSTGEAGFRIERSADGVNAWQQIGTSTASTFTDTSVACGTTYQYRVTAYWSDGQASDPSEAVSGQSKPCAPPPPTLIRRIPINAGGIWHVPSSGLVYLSMLSTGNGAAGNSIQTFDLASETFGTSTFIGSEPHNLALSDDGQILHVGLNGGASYRMLPLSTMTPLPQHTLSNICNGPCIAHDMAAVPGNSNAVAIARHNHEYSPSRWDVAIYDSGIQRPKATPCCQIDVGAIAFGSPSLLYGYSGGELITLNVDASGVSFTGTRKTVLAGRDVRFMNGLIYAGYTMIDPATLNVVRQSLSWVSPDVIQPATEWNKLFLYDPRGMYESKVWLPNRVYIFEHDTYTMLGFVTIPEGGTGYGIVPYGDKKLAVLTSSGLYLIDLNHYIDPPLVVEAAPVSPTRMDLNWTQSGINTDEFHIERSEDGLNWQHLGTSTGKFFSDPNVACRRLYYYRVRAHQRSTGLFSEYNSTTVRGATCATATLAPTIAPTATHTPVPVTPTVTPVGDEWLPAGYYEENAPGIVITDMWIYADSSRASGGHYYYSYRDGATILFSFIGAKMTFIRQMGTNRGKVQVCIDSACQIIDNYAASTLWKQPVSFTVPYGRHNVSIRTADGSTIDLDAVQIDDSASGAAATPTSPDTAGALPVGYYEQTHADISYGGTWSSLNASRASGGSYTYSWRRDAQISFRFTGSTLTLIRRRDTSRGEVQVCIDGVCQTITNYAESNQWQAPISFTVTEGTHTVEIRNTGGKTFDLDAVRIESTPTSAVGPGTPSVGLLAAALVGLLLVGRWMIWNRN